MMGSWARVVAALALAHGTAAQPRPTNKPHASITTTQMSSTKAGYATYQVGVNFDSGSVQDVYALFGDPGDAMIIPPAFQVDAPFGVDVGPVSPLLMRLVARIIVCHAVRTDLRVAMCRRGAQTNPAFFPVMPDAEFDSFLTIGLDGPALTPGAPTVDVGPVNPNLFPIIPDSQFYNL